MKTTEVQLPEELKDFTFEQLCQGAAIDFAYRRLHEETSKELFHIRLGGLSLLQFYNKELIGATEEDIGWYRHEHTKQLIYDIDEDRRLIMRDPDEAKEYFKQAYREEKIELEEYIKEHRSELDQKYPLYTSEWFIAWYYFWMDYPIDKNKLDWAIFFSLANPRPKSHPFVRFSAVMFRLNTLQRQEIRPKYLKWCWDTLEIRNRILKGEMFNHNEIICPYSTVYNYILHKASPRPTTMNQVLHKQRSDRDKLLSRISHLKASGNEIELISGGKAIGRI